jgi:hypothetical protein
MYINLFVFGFFNFSFPPHACCCCAAFVFSPLYLNKLVKVRKQSGCVTLSLSRLAIYIKKKYLKAKEEELWKLKYISPCKNIFIFKKHPLKQTQNPSRSYYN